MRTLILVGLFFITAIVNGQELIFEKNIDMNSDDKIDSIHLEHINGTFNEFKLKIGEAEIIGKIGEGETEGFKVIDIDKNDKFKEIAVHGVSPGYGQYYAVYWYNGEQIIKIENLFGNIRFLGNGIVYINSWNGFWAQRDKYLLNPKTRELDHIPQYAYYVGVKITVKESFTIYSDKDLVNKVALLSKGSEIELILCDNRNKNYQDSIYLIRSKSGLIGWARFKEIYANSSGFKMAG